MTHTFRPGLILASGAAVALLGAGTAQAANTGLYAGAALGEANTHLDHTTFNIHDSDGAWKAFAGYRPLGLFGAEVSYVDFGRASANGARSDTHGVDAMAIGYLPIPLVDIFGKVGLVSWQQSTHGPAVSFHRNGADLAYGAGVGAHFGALGVRLEYERFQVSDANKLSLTSLGISWSFL